MAFTDYRNNDLAKYRSTFADYTAEEVIGKEDGVAPGNFIDMGAVSGTVSLDTSKYNYFRVVVSDDIVISGTHSLRPKNLNTFYVEIQTPGDQAIAWHQWFEWSSNVTPDLTSSGTYILSFVETNIVTAGSLSYTNCVGYLG